MSAGPVGNPTTSAAGSPLSFLSFLFYFLFTILLGEEVPYLNNKKKGLGLNFFIGSYFSFFFSFSFHLTYFFSRNIWMPNECGRHRSLKFHHARRCLSPSLPLSMFVSLPLDQN